MSKELKNEIFKLCAAVLLFAIVIVIDKQNICSKYIILLYLIPYLLAGAIVLKEAFLGIIHGEMLDESFLMTLASVGAFATGEYAEAAAVMIFFQIGEAFEDYALGRSRQSISDLMDIAPERAFRENAGGNIEEILPKEIQIDDLLIVRPGEKIPIDGVVISGESMVNTAALTGESVPRSARAGDPIISGCVNGSGLLKIRATKIYEDSTVARILDLLENASEHKSHTENFITRFARVYTPLVVGAAVLLALIPGLLTGDWLVWAYRACTFLVVSCPCALVISVPLAFFGGIGAASKNGVLVKGSNYLELLSKVNILVCDKTGTLTEGDFSVSSIIPASGFSKEEVLQAAASAESLSTHPIAVSIMDSYGKDRRLPGIINSENIPGEGLLVQTEEGTILAGNKKLFKRFNIVTQDIDSAAATICYIAKDSVYLGAILIRDTVKKEAPAAIKEIKANGVEEIIMLTGDHRVVAEEVGDALSIDEIHAEMLPQDKLEKIDELMKDNPGKCLAFIGDGINDAPTLARADIGIAMGGIGADAAIEAADIVIMDDKLSRLPAVIRIARRTRAISRQNIIFALTVKGLVLFLGAIGIAGMWAAVFADVGVAFLCILNSMRLLLIKRAEKTPGERS